MRFYGLDLQRDLGTDRLSWRRLGVLLTHLPYDSATVRAVGGEEREWGYVEHLLATLCDLVAESNWLFISANSKQRPPQPKPITRPGHLPRGQKRRGNRSFTPAELEQIFERAREG